MQHYTVATDREVMGIWRKAGKPFTLTDEQAKHLLPPHGSEIQRVAAPKPKSAAK